MTLTVYGAPASPFVRKVRVFLAEKNQPYTLEPVNIFRPPEWFEEISPLKRIPVLRDESGSGEDVIIPDSSAICAYLDRRFPDPALYPAEAAAYARALWFEEYTDSELAMNIGMGVFRPIVVAQLTGSDPDLDRAIETCTKKLPRYFDYLDKELTGREFAVGDSFTIADISIATQFVNLQHAGIAPNAELWPALSNFLSRMHARPSFAACIEEETPFFAKITKLDPTVLV